MENPPAQCPFLKQACIRDKCELYQEISITAPGALVGMQKQGLICGCSINAIAFFVGRLNAIALTPPPPERHSHS